MCILEPNNIRQLAQRLQNTTGHPTNYSKANRAIHDLTISRYLKHNYDNKKFFPNIPKLIEDIETILKSKGEVLTDEDKKIFSRFLKNRYFLKFISDDIIKKIQSQPKGKHSVNALEFFCERVGTIAATMAAMRPLNANFRKIIDNFQGLSYEEIEERLNLVDKIAETMSPYVEEYTKNHIEKMNMPNKEFLSKFLLGFFKLISSALPLMTFSDSLLRKLAKLWDKYEGFLLAEQIFKSKIE